MGRRLGQHFLRDPAILDRIVDGIDPRDDDVVLEIGAGEGTLTRRLAARVGRVVAIEKDEDLVAGLRDAGASGHTRNLPENVTIVAADALAVDWHAALRLPSPEAPFKVAGNIPYAITSPLIEKALTPPLPRVVVLLVQREVADRLAASPGGKEYGALSVGVQTAATVQRLFIVRAGAFSPPPKVESAVVRLTPRGDLALPRQETAAFRAFVTALFGQRRKQLQRSLRNITQAPRTEVEAALDRLGVTPETRPEALAPETFVKLFLAMS